MSISHAGVHVGLLLVLGAATPPKLSDSQLPNDAIYLRLVSVGCAPAAEDEVRYVWHTQVPGLSTEESTRAFKHLASPDVERCLSALVRAEPKLYDRLLSVGPETPAEESDRVLTEARSVWARHGVAQAFAEVARTGRRGPLLTALLETCVGSPPSD